MSQAVVTVFNPLKVPITQFITTHRAQPAGDCAGSWIYLCEQNLGLAHKELTGQSANEEPLRWHIYTSNDSFCLQLHLDNFFFIFKSFFWLCCIFLPLHGLFSSCGYWGLLDFPGGSDGKASAYNAGALGSIPGLGRFLEKVMATHSSTLAWKIPWTEEPGRLQSMGLQRVGHDWATSLHFSSCGARAFHCGGFSCCEAQALGLAGFSSHGTWAQ